MDCGIMGIMIFFKNKCCHFNRGVLQLRFVWMIIDRISFLRGNRNTTNVNDHCMLITGDLYLQWCTFCCYFDGWYNLRQFNNRRWVQLHHEYWFDNHGMDLCSDNKDHWMTHTMFEGDFLFINQHAVGTTRSKPGSIKKPKTIKLLLFLFCISSD